MKNSFYIENSKVVNVKIKRISANSSGCITTVITENGKTIKKPLNKVLYFEGNDN